MVFTKIKSGIERMRYGVSKDYLKEVAKMDISKQMAALTYKFPRRLKSPYKSDFNFFLVEAKKFVVEMREKCTEFDKIGLFEKRGRAVFDLLSEEQSWVTDGDSSPLYFFIPRVPDHLSSYRYKKISNDIKNERVIIFDDCIHRGINLRAVKKILEANITKVVGVCALVIPKNTLEDLEEEFDQIDFHYLYSPKDETWGFYEMHLFHLHGLYKLYYAPLEGEHLVFKLSTNQKVDVGEIRNFFKKWINVFNKTQRIDGAKDIDVPPTESVSFSLKLTPKELPIFMSSAIEDWEVRVSCTPYSGGYKTFIWGYMLGNPFKCTGEENCSSKVSPCFLGWPALEKDPCLECYNFQIEKCYMQFVKERIERMLKNKRLDYSWSHRWDKLEAINHINKGDKIEL